MTHRANTYLLYRLVKPRLAIPYRTQRLPIPNRVLRLSTAEPSPSSLTTRRHGVD